MKQIGRMETNRFLRDSGKRSTAVAVSDQSLLEIGGNLRIIRIFRRYPWTERPSDQRSMVAIISKRRQKAEKIGKFLQTPADPG